MLFASYINIIEKAHGDILFPVIISYTNVLPMEHNKEQSVQLLKDTFPTVLFLTFPIL